MQLAQDFHLTFLNLVSALIKILGVGSLLFSYYQFSAAAVGTFVSRLVNHIMLALFMERAGHGVIVHCSVGSAVGTELWI